jgi:Fanconi-associated nuclease 1
VASRRGVATYPRYTVRRSWSAFPTRQALLRYELALSQATLLDDALTAEDWQGAERCLEPAWQAIRSGSHRAAAEEEVVSLDPVSSPTAVPTVDPLSTSRSRAAAAEARQPTRATAAAVLVTADAAGEGDKPPDGSGSCESGAAACQLPEEPSAASSIVAASSVLGRPAYLARFCDTWVYVGLCAVGVSLFEKDRM